LAQVSLEDALRLVHLYAGPRVAEVREGGDQVLRRYLNEQEPTLDSFAEVVANLAQRLR